MKNLLKYVSTGLMLVVLTFSINVDDITAKGDEEYKDNVWYEETGELTDYHKEFMQDQWCKFNKGQDFAEKQCEK